MTGKPQCSGEFAPAAPPNSTGSTGRRFRRLVLLAAACVAILLGLRMMNEATLAASLSQTERNPAYQGEQPPDSGGAEPPATFTEMMAPDPTETSTPIPTPTGTETPTATPAEIMSPASTTAQTATDTVDPGPPAPGAPLETPTPTWTATELPAATATSIYAACADSYEPDDLPALGPELPMDGTGQKHTLHGATDVDWFRIEASAGKTYTITTSNLISVTDTILHLYDDIDGTTLVAVNDDYPGGGYASRLAWTAGRDGPFYLRARDFYSRGRCLGYTISGVGGARSFSIWAPVTLREAQSDTPTPTPTPTGIPEITPTVVPVPGMVRPSGIAIHPSTHAVYVTASGNDTLYKLDGLTHELLDQAEVGSRPWGVAVNPNTDKVYVGSAVGGRLHVLDATTLDELSVIYLPLNALLTFLDVNLGTNHIYAVDYANNTVWVIDGETDQIVAYPRSGVGLFGIAVNEHLNRVYVSNRDSATVVTFDGQDGYRTLDAQTIGVCGPYRPSPYALGFNNANNKLYVACAAGDEVNHVPVYAATAEGLSLVADIKVENGGADGGGGIAINPVTGHVFITNSAANSVSVISAAQDDVLATIPVGRNPFGVAVDPGTRKVFVANRDSNTLTVLPDDYAP